MGRSGGRFEALSRSTYGRRPNSMSERFKYRTTLKAVVGFTHVLHRKRVGSVSSTWIEIHVKVQRRSKRFGPFHEKRGAVIEST